MLGSLHRLKEDEAHVDSISPLSVKTSMCVYSGEAQVQTERRWRPRLWWAVKGFSEESSQCLLCLCSEKWIGA